MEHQNTKDAIGALDLCSNTAAERTREVSLVNKTGWTIVIAFAQCEDLSGNIPQGFVKDTGVFVVASNQAGPSTASVDPCHVGGGLRPCQATRVTCNYKLRWPGDTTEYDYNCPPADDGDNTTYFGRVWWTIEYTKGMNKEGRPNAAIVPLKLPKAPVE
jgi:hypothetical protein